MLVTEVSPAAWTKGPGGADQAPRASFPLGMERPLVFAHVDWPHAVHAAHVVDTVHAAAPRGAETFATPTIASRVTRAASCSSVIRSVPGGRSGSTR